MLAIVVALSLSASDWACDYSQEKWIKAGLDAPCKVMSGDGGPVQLSTVMKRWSLNEAQARSRARHPSMREGFTGSGRPSCRTGSPADRVPSGNIARPTRRSGCTDCCRCRPAGCRRARPRSRTPR